MLLLCYSSVTQTEERKEIQRQPPLTSTGVSHISSPPSKLPTFTGPFRVDLNKYRAPETRLVPPKVPQLDLSCFEGNDKIPVLPTSK